MPEDKQLEAFMREQIANYKKNYPDAHKKPVPDGMKRQMRDLTEKIEKFKTTSRYKDLVKEYSYKLKKLKEEKEWILKNKKR